ncbi:hypothetical protein BpHYR1_005738 [Brachionus plicatilis]|uniref:Uncharacterized protein n=1 Tax=Brachionus plicatilis TaxID=10195 RepID=A0A3M7S1N2_BRAPC|nr:hypothetical protein BpHYR1_005738 [Brachionus plicatilis]
MYILSFRGLPERLRSEAEPVSSYRFLVEETHFGDTPNNLANNFRPSEELESFKIKQINHKGVKKGCNGKNLLIELVLIFSFAILINAITFICSIDLAILNTAILSDSGLLFHIYLNGSFDSTTKVVKCLKMRSFFWRDLKPLHGSVDVRENVVSHDGGAFAFAASTSSASIEPGCGTIISKRGSRFSEYEVSVLELV